MKKEEKELEGGRCLKEIDCCFGFIEEDRAKICKELLKKIMN